MYQLDNGSPEILIALDVHGDVDALVLDNASVEQGIVAVTAVGAREAAHHHFPEVGDLCQEHACCSLQSLNHLFTHKIFSSTIQHFMQVQSISLFTRHFFSPLKKKKTSRKWGIFVSSMHVVPWRNILKHLFPQELQT